MENIWMGLWKVSSPPFSFLLLLSHFLSTSPLFLSHTLSLSLSLPSPRGPRVALLGGLAPNHPELVGGNRRLPAGCLVTADPWDTHAFLHTQAKHRHTSSYVLTEAFAVISWHLSIHVPPTTRSCQGHVNWITAGGLPWGRAKSLARPLPWTSLNQN